MKLFQILTIIFCLGFFLIPKDNLSIQSAKETCCKSEHSEKKDCCKDHQSTSKKEHEKSKSSCNDDCCSTCVACFTFIETPFSKAFLLELSYYKANKKLLFEYCDPHLSDRLKEIWEPPKLA
ncbi:hypothetical protein CJF12_13165 [Chryseobacterium piperi]|uniref:hypothetical protein n=1 Tax=Chryseobacterium piperi TaxID=558152 RepID=UPI000A02C7E9|nr:hypothetical protein [Chryseobacterium piperi]ASW75136.1 hypothetical protein CJF12_13165 [Chryseobacterium piperi]